MQSTGCALNRDAAITGNCRVVGVEAMEKVDGTNSGRTSHELQHLWAAQGKFGTACKMLHDASKPP